MPSLTLRTFRLVVLGAMTWLAVGASAGAESQAPPNTQPAAKDSGARMEAVADGVYVIIHDNATEEWPHGNTGVVVTTEGVLVIDSTYLPSRARADIALIRSVTKQQVRYLVNTHWHFDHNNGAVAYREAFKGLTYIAERDSKHYIEVNSEYWSKMQSAPQSPKHMALADLEAQSARGKDKQGQALTSEAKQALALNIAQRKNELAELAALTVVAPNLTFDDELELELGGRHIEIRNRGRANSPNDVTVYLPKERVLFTGDIVVSDPLPYLSASWPLPWIDVLKRLELIDVAALVPGHGPVMHDHVYTQQVRGLLEAAVVRVELMAREGKTLEEVQTNLNLDDVRKTCPAWNTPGSDEDWQFNVKSLAERVWHGVRGHG